MAWSRLLGQVVLDIISFIVVLAPAVGVTIFAKPFHRGFFCDDDSIGYPYHDDSVQWYGLLAFSVLLPLLVIIVAETLQHRSAKRKSASSSCTVSERRDSNRNYFLMVYKVFGIYLFGLAVSSSIMIIGKYSIGRLRPHFLAVCKPNLAFLNCTNAIGGNSLGRYVTDDVCTTNDTQRIMEARLSFPSGHASSSFYAAIFVAMYLQKRMTWTFSRLLKPCIQSVVIFTASYIALSRIFDYKHHWSDVLAGSIVGGTPAALTVLYILSQVDGWKVDQYQYQILSEGDTTPPPEVTSEQEP